MFDPKHFEQAEGTLPEDRIDSQRPFEVVGLDFIEPGCIFSPNSEEPDLKRIIVTFSCWYTQAVSLQVLQDKRFSSFHAAYDVFRFTQDVHPVKIKSNNALTFEQAANKERIRTLVHEIKWEFNPPGAAWWGGFYKRLVKLIKQKFVLCFGKQKFTTFEDFRVAVAYLERFLNNRPIYVPKEKGDEFLSIRPGQFMNYGHQDNYFRMMENILSERSETPVGGKMLTEILKTQTKFQQRLKRVFDTYYINTLGKHQWNKMFWKRDDDEPKLKPGDFVLFKPTNIFKEKAAMTRLQWDVAQVTAVYTGKDGHICTIDLVLFEPETKETVELFRYPIQHFAPCKEIDEPTILRLQGQAKAQLPIYNEKCI